MTDNDVTLSEIYRMVQRIDLTLKDVPGLVVRVAAVEDDIQSLQTDMKTVRRDTAVVSGGIGVAAFIASIWPFGRP